VILNIVPEAGHDTYIGENRPIAEKQRQKLTTDREEKLEKNSDAASGTLFRVSKCLQRSKNNHHLFFTSER
jgi:hypothetical protein